MLIKISGGRLLHIREFQKLMKELYFHRDSKRGLFKTFTWLVQEIGELGRALLDNDRKSLKEEVGDVFAWLASLCNILDIDLEESTVSKYNGVCPKCGEKPCRCLVE